MAWFLILFLNLAAIPNVRLHLKGLLLQTAWFIHPTPTPYYIHINTLILIQSIHSVIVPKSQMKKLVCSSVPTWALLEGCIRETMVSVHRELLARPSATVVLQPQKRRLTDGRSSQLWAEMVRSSSLPLTCQEGWWSNSWCSSLACR